MPAIVFSSAQAIQCNPYKNTSYNTTTKVSSYLLGLKFADVWNNTLQNSMRNAGIKSTKLLEIMTNTRQMKGNVACKLNDALHLTF